VQNTKISVTYFHRLDLKIASISFDKKPIMRKGPITKNCVYTFQTKWVCDAGWIPYFGQSAFSLGSTIGTLVLGLLADKIGRLPVLLISNAIAAAANVVTALSPTTLVSYAVVRLIAGTASDCNFNMMYLLGTFLYGVDNYKILIALHFGPKQVQ